MTLQERQKREIEELTKGIKDIEIDAGGWGDFNPNIEALAIPLRKALDQVKSDPETYFKNIDEEE